MTLPEERRSGPEDFSGMFQMYLIFTTDRKPDEDGFQRMEASAPPTSVTFACVALLPGRFATAPSPHHTRSPPRMSVAGLAHFRRPPDRFAAPPGGLPHRTPRSSSPDVRCRPCSRSTPSGPLRCSSGRAPSPHHTRTPPRMSVTGLAHVRRPPDRFAAPPGGPAISVNLNYVRVEHT